MPLRPVKVLRVLPDLATGGGVRQCLEVMERFQQEYERYQIQVDLATMYPPRSGFSMAVPDGAVHHHFDLPKSPRGLLAAARRLAALLPDYDCVHPLIWHGVYAAALANSDVPLVASIHFTQLRDGIFGWKKLLDRRFYGQATAIAFCSEASRRYLAGRFRQDPQSAPVVNNGKRIHEGPWPARSGLVTITRHGAFTWTRNGKRPDLLLDAAALLPERQDFELRFLGFGTATEAFQREVDKRSLTAIACIGEVPEVTPYLAAAEILALPTDHEGMPNTILEAWNTRTAVIASRVSGVKELVRDGIDGLLVDNTPQAWATGLKQLIEDPDLRQRLADAGRLRLEQEFSLDATVAGWAQLYRRVIGAD